MLECEMEEEPEVSPTDSIKTMTSPMHSEQREHFSIEDGRRPPSRTMSLQSRRSRHAAPHRSATRIEDNRLESMARRAYLMLSPRSRAASSRESSEEGRQRETLVRLSLMNSRHFEEDDEHSAQAVTPLNVGRSSSPKPPISVVQNVTTTERESGKSWLWCLLCCLLFVVVVLIVLFFLLGRNKKVVNNNNNPSATPGPTWAPSLGRYCCLDANSCDEPCESVVTTGFCSQSIDSCTQCGGVSCGGVTWSPTTSAPTPTASPPPSEPYDVTAHNLFEEAEAFYVPPQWRTKLEETIFLTSDPDVAANMESYRDVGVGGWFTSRALVNGSESTGQLRGMLEDASRKDPVPLVVLVLYNLPNRNCNAGTSTGELCCAYNDDGTCDFENSGDCEAGLNEYKSGYVDLYVDALEEFDGVVPMAVIVEPDSLPNLVTNFDIESCGNDGTYRAYTQGVQYAVHQIAARTRKVAVYLDAAHGGWLGWKSSMEAFADLVESLDLIPYLRGFSTNTANYQPLGVPCPDDVDCVTDSIARDERACCQDPCDLVSSFNYGHNEENYARALVQTFQDSLDWTPHVVIDTSRNGNPDARDDCSHWCNPRDTRVGLRSTARTRNPAVVDAYFWMKAPGQSDGCTQLLPSTDDPFVSSGVECPSFDESCESEDSLGTRPNEPFAPEAGVWFGFQMQMLAGAPSYRYSPTAHPTSEPTDVVPSVAPTSTFAPTLRRIPTTPPSTTPTDFPVFEPTHLPTPPRPTTLEPTQPPTPPRPTMAPTLEPTYAPSTTCAGGWDDCFAGRCCEGYKCVANDDNHYLCQPDEDRVCGVENDECTDDTDSCCRGLTCYWQHQYYAQCLPSCPEDWICDAPSRF